MRKSWMEVGLHVPYRSWIGMAGLVVLGGVLFALAGCGSGDGAAAAPDSGKAASPASPKTDATSASHPAGAASPASTAAPGAGSTGQPSAPNGDARRLLLAMANAYRGAKSYADRGVLHHEIAAGSIQVNDTVPFALTLVRPNQIRLQAYQATLISDGTQMVAWLEDLPGQFLVKTAPQKLGMEQLAIDPNFMRALAEGIAGTPPQLLFLLQDNSIETLLAQAEEPTLLEPAKIDEVAYQRVAIRWPEGTATFWIHPASHAVRRIEFPTDAWRRQLAASGTVEKLVLVADFVDAQFNQPAEPSAFHAELPADAQQVKFFVPPDPAQLLGESIPEFAFTDLSGTAVSRESLAGKPAVIDFWATDCQPCRASLPNLEKVRQAFQDRVNFVAVSVDMPAVTNDELTKVFTDLGVGVPIARDAQNAMATVFLSSGIPLTFVLDGKGVVQDVVMGADPNLTESLTDKLTKVLAGQDIFQAGRDEYQKRLEDYGKKVEEQIQQIASGGASPSPDAATVEREIPETPIAPQSAPERLKLTSLWKCTELTAPVNILVVPKADGSPRVLVVDSWKSVVEMGLDGKVAARHDLKLPQQEAVAFLRSAVGSDGKRYFAGSLGAMQQVHVYDDQFQVVAHFPEHALESPHAGIGDVEIGDLDGDGVLNLYVGYWGDVGVHGVTLEGTRLWAERSLQMVLSLAETGSNAQNQRDLLCVNMQGTLAVVGPDGVRKPDVTVGRWNIRVVASGDLTGDGQPEYCALATPERGAVVALGVNLKGQELWRYDLPHGVHRMPIDQVVPGRVSAQGDGVWLLPAADGSIHILGADGKQIDRFNTGSVLCGLATVESEGKCILLVSSPTALEAWQIE